MAKIAYACATFTHLKTRLPQIYCRKERLGTFGVWDYQNDSPALFRTMEMNYRNTILSSVSNLKLLNVQQLIDLDTATLIYKSQHNLTPSIFLTCLFPQVLSIVITPDIL